MNLLDWLLFGLFDDPDEDSDEYAEYLEYVAKKEEEPYDGHFEKPRHMGRQVFFILLVLWAVVIGYGVAQIVAVWIYPNHGNLQLIGVEAYWDAELTTPVTDLDWGIMEAGEIKQFAFYVYNNGNTPITITMATSTWEPPEIMPYLTFDPNYQSTHVIEVNATYYVGVQLIVELDIPANQFTDFTFLTHIEADKVVT